MVVETLGVKIRMLGYRDFRVPRTAIVVLRRKVVFTWVVQGTNGLLILGALTPTTSVVDSCGLLVLTIRRCEKLGPPFGFRQTIRVFPTRFCVLRLTCPP